MSEIEIARDGPVARLALNRPAAGNAFNQPMADALLDAALTLSDDPAIRAVTLTGTGKMFCVGGDIGDFAANSDAIAPFLSRLAGTLHQALAVLAAMDKPFVTLVNGPAAGAGLSLSIAGDVALADPSAHFTAAYTAIGLTPDGGMTWTLPRLIGLRRAQEMVLTNRRVSAEEAAAIGLVTRLAAPGALAQEGAALAATLAAGPVGALAAARRLMRAGMSETFPTQMDAELRSIAAAGSGPEGREGVAAFRARRKPDFTEGTRNG